jgi:hypothetical protein
MRWAEQCRQWCYYRNEGDKFGDQKYLDEWPKIYAGHVCEIENIGAGLAPWNLPNYKITSGPCADGKPIMFYHAHEFQWQSWRGFGQPSLLTNYPLRQEDRTLIYFPYIREHQELTLQLETA